MTFIIRPDRDEEQTRAVIETVIGRITSAEGELIAAIPWNPPRRRMAYPIRDFGDGFYVTTVFRVEPAALRTIENALKLNDNILRFLVVQATDQNIKQAQQRLQQQQAAAAPQPAQAGATPGAPAPGVVQETVPTRASEAPVVAPPEVADAPIIGTEPADAASDLAQPAPVEAVPIGPVGAEPEE
jgi:small subunit ribosomal protein S6